MIELRSSKKNIGTQHHSFLGIISKIFLKIIIPIIFLLIIIAFITPRFMPIEKIIPIPEITSKIHEKTGLNIKINGKARISIIPFLGITAQNIEITNSSFTNPNLLSAKHIEIKIAILPLIFKKIVIKNIILEKSTINIIQHNGTYNFFTPQTTTTQHKITIKPKSKFFNIQNIRIKNLIISNSNFFYTKHSNSTTPITHKLTNLNTKISIQKTKNKINLTSSFHFNNHKFNINLESSNIKQLFQNKTSNSIIKITSDLGNIHAHAQYTINPNIPTFFEDLQLEFTSTDTKFNEYFKNHNHTLSQLPPIDITFHAILKKNIFQISNLTIQSPHILYTSKNIQGSINLKNTPNNLTNSITSNGTIQFEINNINNLFNTLEINTNQSINLPKKINGTFTFNFINNTFKTTNGNISIDNQPIQFSSNSNFLENNTTIKIHSNQFNLDQYLFQPPQNTQNTKPQSTQKTNKPIFLPPNPKHTTEILLTINELTLQTKKFTEFSLNSKINNNSTLLKLNTNAFDGSISIISNISSHNNQLQSISTEIITKNTEIKDILSYFTKKNLLEGKMTSHINISANGSTINELLQNNKGKMEFHFPYLTVKGFDANTLINDIKTDYKKMLSGTIKEKYLSINKQSKFNNTSGKIITTNGIITNEKTTITLENIHIITSGMIDINKKNITHKIEIINNNILPSIIASGDFSDIKYSIDAKGYIQQNTKKILEKEFSNPNVQKKIEKIESLFKNLKK